LIGWLTPMAHKPRGPEQLVPILIDELRRRRILLPSAAVLEMIVHQARARAESTVHRALLEGLGTDTRASLDRLLEPMRDDEPPGLAQDCTAVSGCRNILGLTEPCVLCARSASTANGGKHPGRRSGGSPTKDYGPRSTCATSQTAPPCSAVRVDDQARKPAHRCDAVDVRQADGERCP
jgi:hypothetical protein